MLLALICEGEYTVITPATGAGAGAGAGAGEGAGAGAGAGKNTNFDFWQPSHSTATHSETVKQVLHSNR